MAATARVLEALSGDPRGRYGRLLDVLYSTKPEDRDATAEVLLSKVDRADEEVLGAITEVYLSRPCEWSKLEPLVRRGNLCRPELQLPGMKQRLAQLFALHPAERGAALKRLMELLTTVSGESEFEALEYAIDELVAQYRASRDERILDALDSVLFDAAWGVDLCRFYRETYDVPEVAEHYAKRGASTKNLTRCRVASGISVEIHDRLMPS